MGIEREHHGRVRDCTVPVKHSETRVEGHATELASSVQTSQMRMVSVLRCYTTGSQGYLPEVWGDAPRPLAGTKEGNRSRDSGQGASKEPMQYSTKEIRDGLLDLLADTDHPATKRTLRATINHLNQMAADLRRAGFADYDRTEKDTTNE